MTNETILKLAAKQAELTNKLAECAVLRNQIAELKKSAIATKRATKPAVKKPSTTKRKPVTKK